MDCEKRLAIETALVDDLRQDMRDQVEAQVDLVRIAYRQRIDGLIAALEAERAQLDAIRKILDEEE